MNNLIKTFSFLLITIIIFSSQILFAQDEIDSDRPDKTDSPQTLEKNKFQIETGIEYSLLKLKGFDEAGLPAEFNFKTFTAPTTLLRFGISKNIELRLGVDFDRQSQSSSNDSSGFNNSSNLSINPPVLSVKIKLNEGKGWVPDFAILPEVQIPNIGNDDKKVKHFVPGFALLFSNNINERLDLGYNLGVEWSDNLEEKEFFYSTSLGIKINSKFSSFVELYGNIPTDVNSSNQNMDAGLMFLLKNNIQLDVYGGIGLSESSNNFMMGTGISLKF